MLIVNAITLLPLCLQKKNNNRYANPQSGVKGLHEIAVIGGLAQNGGVRNVKYSIREYEYEQCELIIYVREQINI